MGCPTEINIGDDLVFAITTHDPDTGILTNADAAPTYRIYENEGGAAIMNGVMAALDPVHTTGFYTETIACTVANGFHEGMNYTIYVEATVGGDTGGITFTFRTTE